MKNKWHLVWVIPAVILVATGLALTAVKLNADRQFKRQPVIEVTPNLRLRMVAVLTAANPEYMEGETAWVKFCTKIKLRNYLPDSLKKIAPLSSWSYKEKYYGSDGTGMKLVFEITGPSGASSSIGSDIRSKLSENHFESYQLEYAPGFQSDVQYLNVTTNRRSSASPGTAAAGKTSAWASLNFSSVPINMKTLKLQSVDTSDYNNKKIVSEVIIPNPLYRKVDALDKPAQKMPVTVTHGNMEFTLRAVVSQVQKDAHLMNYVKSPIKDGITSLSASVFPKGDPVQGYNTVLAINLTNTDPTTSTWVVDWPSITYGKEGILFRLNSFGSQDSGGGTTLLSVNTDISQLPQPIQISVPLKRGDKFPPDEDVTIDLPFPKNGEGFDSTATATLWDKQVDILGISYGSTNFQPGSLAQPIPPSYQSQENTLKVFLKCKQQASLKNIILTGPESKFTLDGYGSSSFSSNGTHCYAYDLGRQSFDPTTRNYIKPTTEDYTTVTLRFLSPRSFPRTFDFVVTPELATGAPQPRDM